jgi:hypothetical protein
MSHELHKKWLKVSAVIVGSFGPVFFLGTIKSTSEPARLTLALLGLRAATSYEAPETRFLSALTGGFLLGWGVTLWQLSSHVYDHAPEAVRKSVLAGFLSWFVLDSAGSIASGNPSNALFNIPVLLAAVGPMWTPAKSKRN